LKASRFVCRRSAVRLLKIEESYRFREGRADGEARGVGGGAKK